MDLDHLSALLERIEHAHPRASILYAMILIALSSAKNGALLQGDLSEELGKGRDASAVQTATARMEALGIVTRELLPADGEHGRTYIVRLALRAKR